MGRGRSFTSGLTWAPRCAMGDLNVTLDVLGFQSGEVFQLVAITFPEKTSPVAESFEVGNEDNLALARSFVERFDGKRNLYICLNPLKAKRSAKVRDQDIATSRVLLVDADPTDAGDGTLEFCQKAKRLLAQGTIVSSGRGHQLWVSHDPDLTEWRASVLEALRKRFGNPTVKIDATHDISRIARLPGTINLKTGKRSKIL